jgi:hypothetical protein
MGNPVAAYQRNAILLEPLSPNVLYHLALAELGELGKGI